MNEPQTQTTQDQAPQPGTPASVPRRRGRGRLLMIVTGLATLLIVFALGGLALVWDGAEPEGLVFVIPAGAASTLERPTIDSAIEIPTDIRFSASEGGRITIRNEDSMMNRAGPWLVDAGQTYTLPFDNPGTYQFDCAVDPSESVTVTVTE